MTRPSASGRTYWPPIPTRIASTTESGDERGGASPRREQPLDHVARTFERVGAEEDPGEADDVERDDAPDPAAQRRVGGRPQSARLPPVADEPLDREHDAVDSAPDDERPRGAVPEAAEQHRQHQVPVGAQPAPSGCRRAGCRGSREASATASCASGARSPAATPPCTAKRSSAGTGSRGAARCRSRCSCSRRSRRRSAPRTRRRRRGPRATSAIRCGEDVIDDGGREVVRDHDLQEEAGRGSATNARPESTRRGSRGRSSCGSSSLARTIGPATRCGKNDWKTAKRASDAGTSSPR